MGSPRGSRGSACARSFRRAVKRLTASGSAPFCGANTSAARSNGVVTSASTVSCAPRRPPLASIAWIAPEPPSVVAEPPTATATRAAPALTAAAISSPVPSVVAASASRSVAPRGRALALATATIAVEPSSTQPSWAPIGRPSGSWASAPRSDRRAHRRAPRASLRRRLRPGRDPALRRVHVAEPAAIATATSWEE